MQHCRHHAMPTTLFSNPWSFQMAIYFHHDDLPDGIDFGKEVAVDTETMGLNLHRDRLCLVQLSAGDGNAHLVQIRPGGAEAKNLKALMTDPDVLKIFHFGRFDIAAIYRYLGVETAPVFCTKIASKLCRTSTDRHGLRDLCREMLGIEISKQQQTSDWGAEILSDAQQQYAASDVLYLHDLRQKLMALVAREGRTEIAEKCFEFLPTRARLDLLGWEDVEIFHH